MLRARARPLLNNAYDADASLVEIYVSEGSIEIKDNGAIRKEKD